MLQATKKKVKQYWLQHFTYMSSYVCVIYYILKLGNPVLIRKHEMNLREMLKDSGAAISRSVAKTPAYCFW